MNAVLMARARRSAGTPHRPRGFLATAPLLAAALVLAALSGLCGSPGGAAVAAAPTPAHSGRWLLDAQGRVLVVHGLNLVNKLAPYTPEAEGFDAADAAYLRAEGFNVVRLGVMWEALEPAPGVFDTTYLDQIEQTQQLLAGDGIYTLLDFHQDELNEEFGGEGFPAWAVETGGLAPASPHDAFPGEYTEDPAEEAAWDHLLLDSPGPGGIGLQQYMAGMEQYVASAFASAPYVLGYDVVNEPSAGSETDGDQLIGAMEATLIRAIRTVDTTHMVFYEPQAATFPLVGTTLPAFGDPNAGISFHDYCLEPDGMAEWLYTLICGSVLGNAQTEGLARSASTGDAALMTEFGSATPYVSQIVATDADGNMLSWVNWSFCGCGDPTTTISPPSAEGLVVDPAEPPTGSNVNTGDLDVLVRPYPQAVAGTPIGWSYNAGAGTFALAYSTAPPRGVTLSGTATTTVFVPSLRYPNGYDVSVSGGRVVSGDGTETLQVAAGAGSSIVCVVITPR